MTNLSRVYQEPEFKRLRDQIPAGRDKEIQKRKFITYMENVSNFLLTLEVL